MNSMYKEIKEQASRSAIRLHMPGHKGKDILGLGGLLSIDLTELDGLDNLHSPIGILKQAADSMAYVFGADRSFLLVNGSSAGVIASILTVCGEKDVIICARNSHVSLYKGLCLSGAKPVYVLPEVIEPYGICGEISPLAVYEAIKENGSPSAIFVTSPTYEGVVSNIGEIAEIAHKHGSILVVDEAHGSHFKFSGYFPKTALEQGADIVIQSHHKTLAAVGQGAVLHTKGRLVDVERLAFNISVMQTTSPSYIIMASLDKNRELLEKEGAQLFDKYVSNLKSLRYELLQLNNISLFDKASYSLDRGKITLLARNNGMKLYEFLRKQNIYSEMSASDYVLLMTSFADSRADYRLLADAMKRFVIANDNNEYAQHAKYQYNYLPKIMHTPKCAVQKPIRTIKLSDAANKASAGIITAYPPGIPILAIGEAFTEEVMAIITEHPNICGIIEKNGVKYVRIVE